MSHVHKLVISLFFILSAGISSSALANTVTFEDVPLYSNGPSFTSGGFNFSSPSFIGYVANGTYCTPACPDNGTQMFISGFGPSVLTMANATGRSFNLKSFDGAGTFNLNVSADPSLADLIPKQIDIKGLRADGSTVSESFLIDRTSNADGRLSFTQFFANGSFSNLVSVSFRSSGSAWDGDNGFTLDNIVTAAVPEPTPYVMLFAGLGLIGMMVRSRSPRSET